MRLHSSGKAWTSSSHRQGVASLFKILKLYKQYGIRHSKYGDFKVRRHSVPSVGIHSLVFEACAYSVQTRHHFHGTVKHTLSYYKPPNGKTVASFSPVIPDRTLAERVLLLRMPCSLSPQLRLTDVSSKLHHDSAAPFCGSSPSPSLPKTSTFLHKQEK